MYRISTLSCLQHGSFNVDEAGNRVHFIVYGVSKNSKTPNRGNDSGAITLLNSSRPKAENGLLQDYKQQQNKNKITISDNSHTERFQHNYAKRSSPLKHKLHRTWKLCITAQKMYPPLHLNAHVYSNLFFYANTHYHHLLFLLQPNGSHHSYQISMSTLLFSTQWHQNKV